jgi:hypothetical protein
MLPSQAEIARSLQGAWLLAKGDPRGLDLFDLSLEGFWRSFAAALLAAPAYALVLLEQYAVLGWPQHVAGTILAELVAYVCGWIAFPIAAIFLTRLLNLTQRYVPLVVAGNWAGALQIGLYTVVVVASLVLPREMRTILLLAATMAVLAYQWFVIRTALGTSGGTAFGLVVIDVLLSMTVGRVVDGLLQPS